MNKPAPKEPSMDEILSSIRQIIADDDAGAPKVAVPPGPAAAEAPSSPSPTYSFPPDQTAPLPLSTEQIVRDDEVDEDAGEEEDSPEGFADAELVEADDIAFEPEPAAEVPAPPSPPAAERYEPRPAPRPAAPVARSAPMPDPTLSSEIAEQLLEPATNAAVRHTFARLGTLAVGTPSVTIEEMMRDMLRPMLKEWLDENLPSVVERMVEKEIARISRGVQ